MSKKSTRKLIECVRFLERDQHFVLIFPHLDLFLSTSLSGFFFFSGVRYVVDAGLSKRRSFAAATGMDTLRAESCSRSEAKQRAGRAGREAPGKCWRLYTELAFEERVLAAEPEIRRVDLAEVVLQLLVREGFTCVFLYIYRRTHSLSACFRSGERMKYFCCIISV
jgi:hypothetical protein